MGPLSIPNSLSRFAVDSRFDAADKGVDFDKAIDKVKGEK
jgi:hypothetical protein